MNLSRKIIPILLSFLFILSIFSVAALPSYGSSSPTVSGQAVDILQNNVYTYAESFSTGYTGTAKIPSGSGLVAYTANLLASSSSVAAIEILSSSGQILSTAEGHGYYVQDNFDFSFSGQSEYVMELFYSNTTPPPSNTIATSTNGVLAESSDHYQYAFSTNTEYSGRVFTFTQNVSFASLQATIYIYQLTSTPPPSDGTVHFSESGLATGTSWTVTYHTVLSGYTGANSSTSSTTPYINLTMALGNTIYYWISTVNGLTPTPSSGIIDLDQGNITVNVVYPTPVVHDYAVTFVPLGIPSGTTWAVTLNGLQLFQTNLNGQNPDISFSELNGSYSYSVYVQSPDTASPSSGTVTVSGGPVTVYISITQPVLDYTLTFTETGLPSGTDFTVSTNAAVNSGNPSVTFTVPNGTYYYTIANVGNYIPSPSSGSVTISGSDQTVNVVFALATYAVTFTETGLPSGTPWYVNVTGGSSHSSVGATISFSATDGTYSYTISDGNPNYTPSPSSGSFTVNGASVSVSVTFNAATYTVDFDETGLSAGTLWSVTFNGQALTSTTSTITFVNVLRGTYPYTATATGYDTITGNVTISSSSPSTIQTMVGFSPETITTPAPSVSISSSQNYLINGTVTPPAGYGQSFWNILTIKVSSSSFSKVYSFSPITWNFSLQVPADNATYSLSFRLLGTNIVSEYYNATVTVKTVQTSTSHIPFYYAISPPSGSVIYTSRDITLYLKGNVTYSGILTYTSAYGQSPAINLTSETLANGTQALYYPLNISHFQAGQYDFKFSALYDNQVQSSFSAEYTINGMLSITLKYNYNYTVVYGNYTVSFNVSVVDNSSISYSPVNVLNVSLGHKELGFYNGRPFTRNGITRDYFLFNLTVPKGTYVLNVTAYNRTGNVLLQMFSTNYTFSVPMLPPSVTGGEYYYNQTINWLRQGHNAEIVGGIVAAIVIGAAAAYFSGGKSSYAYGQGNQNSGSKPSSGSSRKKGGKRR
ncbi:hypothetical protein [Metallosphaera sp.]|uniref:hypothetical protein n=1 Tax=Metallosphaera sp. TaxID=2020860 RepID=UPI00315E20E0